MYCLAISYYNSNNIGILLVKKTGRKDAGNPCEQRNFRIVEKQEEPLSHGLNYKHNSPVEENGWR